MIASVCGQTGVSSPHVTNESSGNCISRLKVIVGIALAALAAAFIKVGSHSLLSIAVGGALGGPAGIVVAIVVLMIIELSIQYKGTSNTGNPRSSSQDYES